MKAKIGNVSLEINATGIKAGALDKVIASAIKDVIYRPVAGAVFPAGKEAKGFKRDDKWSEALQAKVIEVATAKLGELFETVSITGTAYVAPEKGITMSEDDLLTLITGTDAEKAAVAAKYRKVEAPAEAAAPASEVVEG